MINRIVLNSMGKKGIENIESDDPNKVSFNEFMANYPKEKMWFDGLVVYAGNEPRTMKEWVKDLEMFKIKPEKVSDKDWKESYKGGK